MALSSCLALCSADGTCLLLFPCTRLARLRLWYPVVSWGPRDLDLGSVGLVGFWFVPSHFVVSFMFPVSLEGLRACHVCSVCALLCLLLGRLVSRCCFLPFLLRLVVWGLFMCRSLSYWSSVCALVVPSGLPLYLLVASECLRVVAL